MLNSQNRSIYLDINGVQVTVLADDDACRSQIADDFSVFLTDATPESAVKIVVSLADPPYGRVPARALLRTTTKDARVIEAGGKRYLDSSGDALVIWTFADESVEIFSADRKLLREKAYLMIMSRVGHLLDRRGLHRIHAMGVAFQGRSVVCAMPMGGGKSTLTLGLMEHAAFRLLSDEVPLVSRRGTLRGFPVRLGVCEDAKLSIPDEFVSRFVRTRFPPKLLIDANYFRGRLARNTDPGIFFVGRRAGSPVPAIQPIGSFAAFRALLEMCVRGRGVPEQLEYVLRIQPRALYRQIVIYLSRLSACIALLCRSKCYALELSDDPEANAEFVAEFVAREITAMQPRHADGA